MPSCPNPRCQTAYAAGTTQCTNPRCRCLLPEAIVAGRYRVETLMGIGGMGAVYRASDTFEGEQVALKILNAASTAMDLETASERFRREARYAHQLRHPNIVPVLNFGQDGSLLYITMPLITGGTLKALLKSERPLPTEMAQRYLNELALAIDAIHQHPQQIIHRDLKPSNLLIHQDDQRLVVTDFGIARAMQQEKPLTQEGWIIGTEHYTAPEQEHGKAEPASDIYAMGIVCYQMFTGLLPFQAVIKHHATELPGPSTLNSALPLAIDRVILKAIEIDPEKRYHSGKEFADALNMALSGHDFWSEPTITDSAIATLLANAQENVLVHMIIPENPCGQCGHENRSSSRYCRYCGHSLSDTSPLIHDACQVGYLSESGNATKQNEDMLLIVQGLCSNLAPPPRPFGLFAVADGLHVRPGQPAKSHEASRLVIETIADILLPLLTTPANPPSLQQRNTASKPASNASSQPQIPTNERVEQWLREASRQANQVIYHCNADYDATMASTLTLAMLYKRRLFIASIGDSRAYHYNAKKELRCLTKDHTLAANLVEANLLQPHEVAQNPKRYQLYRYLGQNYSVQIDLFQHDMEPNDLILLCTNGLWHMLSDKQIKAILDREEDPQKLAFMLVEAADSAGGARNISAVVIRVQ